MFGQRIHAKVHERTHTDEKPYPCSYANCDKKFSRSNQAKEHERIHTGEKLHPCNYCDKKFTRSNHAKEHEKIHTGENICTMLFFCKSLVVNK